MRSLAGCLGIAVLICCLQFANAQDKPPLDTPPAAEKAHEHAERHHSDALIAEEVRQRLQMSVTFKCDHASLAEVLANRIATPSKLDFYVDSENIEKSNVAYDELVVSGDFKNVSIRAVLTRILTPAKLAYFCDDTGVCITTREIHDQRLFARVYDVTELIPESDPSHNLPTYGPTPTNVDPDFNSRPSASPSTNLQRKQMTEVTPVRPVQFGGGMGLGAEIPDLVDPHGPSNWNQQLTATSLSAAIKQSTGGNVPDAWAPKGNKGTISVLNTGHAKLMVVRQTEAIHGEVEDLLSEVFTHHHMLKKDGPAGAGAPRNAQLKVVRPNVRTVKQR